MNETKKFIGPSQKMSAANPDMINYGEEAVFGALANGTEHSEIALGGCGLAGVLSAFRKCKRGKLPVRGIYDIDFTEVEGLNVRKVKRTANAFRGVLAKFCNPITERLDHPRYDERSNTLLATDGVMMLACDKPEDMNSDGFDGDVSTMPPYDDIMGCRDNSAYELAHFSRWGRLEKGDRNHRLVKASARCAAAYAHRDEDGLFRDFYVWINGRQFDSRRLDSLLDGMFKLGCDAIEFCFPRYWFVEEEQKYAPLHLVGFGDGLRTRGLLMPMKHPTTLYGGVRLGFNEKEKAANVA